jgi:pyruvate dehydrogenase phosphatase
MSAKSFGTFIDSEPSTPAYSPRMDYEWGDSTLVLLNPMSASSEPSTPTEPAWDMIMPGDSTKQQPAGLHISDPKGPFVSAAQQFFGPRLTPAPTKEAKAARGRSQSAKEIHTVATLSKAIGRPHEKEDGEAKENEEPAVDDSAAPLVKLASKVKFMLRRRSATSEKKKEKKEKDYYGPEEYLHWSER